MTNRARVVPRVLGVAVAAALLAGCSLELGTDEPGTRSVSADDVAEQISERLRGMVGRAPDSVQCPSNLEAEVGASVRCTLVDGETELGVDVTVTEVDGKDVTFDIQVDDEPQS